MLHAARSACFLTVTENALKKGPEDDMEIIARVRTDFPEKFGIPRQSGLTEELKGRIVFEPAYRNMRAVYRLDEFSHIWILWEFSEVPKTEKWNATVRPPRLGGNERVGVFASRSPFRPNPIGLSCVRLEKVEEDPTLGPVLYVSGIDMMDGTPVYDIKPYLPMTDCRPEATNGYTENTRSYRMKVDFPEDLLQKIAPEKQQAALDMLALDPRVSYIRDPERVFGVYFDRWNIRFRVDEDVLTVTEVGIRP